MSKYYRCPHCGGTNFFATAHVTQDWKLNINGVFQESVNDCLETTHYPDEDDIWDCANPKCSFSAPGREFRDPLSEKIAEKIDEAFAMKGSGDLGKQKAILLERCWEEIDSQQAPLEKDLDDHNKWEEFVVQMALKYIS